LAWKPTFFLPPGVVFSFHPVEPAERLIPAAFANLALVAGALPPTRPLGEPVARAKVLLLRIIELPNSTDFLLCLETIGPS
jgi:hypothetical protein